MTSTPEKKGTTAKAPSQARLFHGDELIGLITSITVEDMFQWSGQIDLTAAAARFQPLFDYLNDEARGREPDEPDEDELPFDESLMDDWFVEDENGRREIMYPAVTPQGEVFWRD